MKKICLILLTIILMINHTMANKHPTYLQILYSIKKVFPEAKQVHLLIAQEDLENAHKKIERSSAQSHLKSIIHPIDTPAQINQALIAIPDGEIVVLYPSSLFQKNNIKLFILKKIKEKKMFLVTTSTQYSQSGALLGVLPEEGKKTKIVLNLKHYPYLKEKLDINTLKAVNFAQIIQ